MESTIQSVAVKITSNTGKSQAGRARIQIWDSKQRTRRMFKALGICWGFALVAVLIPGLHFILVPSLLIAGPFVAYSVFYQTSVILDGDGLCPECNAPFKIARSSDRWPLSDLCSVCQAAVVIAKT